MVKSVQDLIPYQKAFDLQQRIFDLTKTFPREEMYSLTDQIRRSSRSVGANITEAWAKRRYPAHFVSKLTDADAECAETQHWLRTAVSCDYLPEEVAAQLACQSDEVRRLLGSMMQSPEKWCIPNS
jgi:four helix bundle protein